MAENSSSDEDFILLAAIAYSRKRKRTRRCWVKNWVENRQVHGAYHALMQELVCDDEQSFRNFLRIDISHFNMLKMKVSHLIEKQQTVLREPISGDERLAVTLRFLASGKLVII